MRVVGDWSDARYERLAERSHALHYNKHVLPVATWIAEASVETIKAPEVGLGLGGRSPANRVMEALERLCAIGALQELPYPGPPQARIFERRSTAYWHFVLAFAEEVESSTLQRACPSG